MTNGEVAGRLEEIAGLLQEQDGNPFRVSAYRRAADTVRRLGAPVDSVVRSEGLERLERRPGIGTGLARVIRDLAITGSCPVLDRLRGEADPEGLLATVPGIGPVLAERLHREFHIGTLEQLEAALHAGALRGSGFGPKRVAGLKACLAARLGRPRLPRERPGEPPVAELLDVDREYRERAEAGTLRTIAPRRFNPAGRAWLPILHTSRGSRHYTALFSNTARAHQLGRTRDWVVIYCDGEGEGERQYTAVTTPGGPSRGHRVIRGREAESPGGE